MPGQMARPYGIKRRFDQIRTFTKRFKKRDGGLLDRSCL